MKMKCQRNYKIKKTIYKEIIISTVVKQTIKLF